MCNPFGKFYEDHLTAEHFVKNEQLFLNESNVF